MLQRNTIFFTIAIFFLYILKKNIGKHNYRFLWANNFENDTDSARIIIIIFHSYHNSSTNVNIVYATN